MKKSLPKIFTLFFLFVFVFQIIGLICILTTPKLGLAADPIKFKPQVSIGDFKKCDPNLMTEEEYRACGKLLEKSTRPIGEYIQTIYKYGIGIVGILATVVMMMGGVMWIVAGGNASRISEAKAWIGASLTGLVLALSSYMILYTVNPDLVNFRVSKISPVEKVVFGGCCGHKYNVNVLADSSATKEFFACYNEQDEEACDPDYNSRIWYEGSTCDQVEGCPQWQTGCTGTNNGTMCGTYKICKNGECVSCEPEGDFCTWDTCCAGLICNTRGVLPDICEKP